MGKGAFDAPRYYRAIGEAPCRSVWFMCPVAYKSYQLHFISIKFVNQHYWNPAIEI